jgi:predicted transcriptional regulator
MAHVGMKAVREYPDWRAAQTSNLAKAIAAGDLGEFADDDEVKAAFAAIEAAADKSASAQEPGQRSRRETRA